MYQNLGKINWHKCHITQTSSDIADIASPLKNLGLHHFSHIKIYPDNSVSLLTTHPIFSQLYTEEKLYKIGLAGDYENYQSGYFLSNSFEDQTIFNALKEKCKLANGFIIVKKDNTSCNFFHFYGRPNNRALDIMYLNHIDMFEQFIAYYYEQASTLIAQLNENRFIYPEHNTRKEMLDFTRPNDIDFDLIKNELILLQQSNVSLTAKERDSLNYLLQGYSPKEIAKRICRSPRTVEKHIANLHMKYNVCSTPKLIAKFRVKNDIK